MIPCVYNIFFTKKIYIVSTTLSVIVLIILTCIRILVIPYFRKLELMTYMIPYHHIFINVLSLCGMYFFTGFGMLSFISLWFDCSVKKSKIYYFGIYVFLLPVFLVLFGYALKGTNETFLANITIFFLTNRIMIVPFQMVFPFVSGVSLFFAINAKRK